MKGSAMKQLTSVLLIVAACIAMPAHAGRPCEEAQPKADVTVKAMELALKARTALESSGAQVALIARVGQDLSKYNLRYSHLGIVWRDHPQGRWLVMHELNSCGTAGSALYNEGLGNFFLDDMFAFETLIVVPNAATQAKLAQLLASDAPLKFHGPQYNMVAYAFSSKYQNSNQWVLELLAAASATDAKIDSRDQAQAWLKMAGYQPITLNIPAMTRLGGRMFRANIAFDDHPTDRRMAGQIDTVTVDSIVRFLEGRERDLTKTVLSVK
jgi:hypothetical protein